MARRRAPKLPPRFEDVTLLGAGGMGEVFRARDQNLDRIVAVKVLSKRIAEFGGVALARFAREALVQAKIDHPNVVKIYDAEVQAERPFLVMEYVPGRDLSQLLESQGRLTIDRVLQLADQIGGALDQLHGAGILHRDLKPANIMVRETDGSAVLMDLGLAGVEGATALTATGNFLGTPYYMAPETFHGRPWTAQTDQYQLGVILFQLLTGERLVTGSNLEELMVRALAPTHTPWPPALKIPEAIQAAIARAVLPEPEDRFRCCLDLARALRGEEVEDFYGQPEAAPSAPTAFDAPPLPASAAPVSPSVPPRRFSWLTVAVGVLGLGVGAFVSESPAPDDIRYRVVGDTLAVDILPGNAHDIRVQSGGSDQPSSSGEDGRLRFLVRGLKTDRDQPVQVSWSGGTGPRVAHRGERLALDARPRIAAGTGLLFEILRPVTFGLVGGSPREHFEAGPHILPAPEGTKWQARWMEEGIEFSEEWNRDDLLTLEAERLLRSLEALDPGAVQADRYSRREKKPSLSLARFEELRSVTSWLPELLRAPRTVSIRRRLFETWQSWQMASYVAGYLGDSVEPLEAPQGGAGARLFRAPGSQSVEVEFEIIGGRRSQEGKAILSTPHGRNLATDQFAEAAQAMTFPWPEHPRIPGTVIEVGVHSRGLGSGSFFEIRSASQGIRLRLWGTKLELDGGDHHKWTTLAVPADLAPTPGEPVNLILRSALLPDAELADIYQIHVGWSPASAGP